MDIYIYIYICEVFAAQIEYLKQEFVIYVRFFVHLECSVTWKVIPSGTEMSAGVLMKRKS